MPTSVLENKKTLWLFGLGSVLCLLLAYAFNFIYLAIAPFAFLGLFFLLSDIRWALLICIATFPLSINPVEFGNALSIDLPDEPLMLIITAVFPLLWFNNRGESIFKNIFKTSLAATILLYFIWTCICVLFSTDVLLSLKFALAKLWYIVPFVLLMAYTVYNDYRFLYKLFQVLVLLSLIVTLYVFLQHAKFNYEFEHINDACVPFFRNHVIYGSYVSVFVPLCAVLIFYTKRFTIKWWILLSLLVVFLLAVSLAYSRAAWAAVLFSGGILLLIRLRIVQYFFLVFYLCLALGIFWLAKDNRYIAFAPKFEHGVMHEDIVEHLIATIKGRDISSNERFYRWVAAVRMSKEKPITGYGPNTFYNNYKSYTVSVFRTWVSRNLERSTTHNYFLFMLVEQGIPGMLFYALLIILIFYQGQQLLRRTKNKNYQMIIQATIGMQAVFFINNFFSELIEVDKLGGLFFCGIGILIALQIKIKEENSLNHGNETIGQH